MIALGYVGRFVQDELASMRHVNNVTAHNQQRIYEIFQVQKLRESLNGQIITVVGAVYASPGKEFFLIPDDELSMRPDNLPPGKAMNYSIRLPDWRFRELESGDINCRIAITGKFGTENGVDCYLDGIAPIDSISWNANLPKQSNTPASTGEQDIPPNDR